MRAILFAGGLALLISLLGTRVAITILTERGYGQEIRDDGADHPPHQARHAHHGRGRIILATVLGYFAAKLSPRTGRARRRSCCSSSSSGCGLVGFLDDYIKIAKQRSLGLRSKAKIIGLRPSSPSCSASWR